MLESAAAIIANNAQQQNAILMPNGVVMELSRAIQTRQHTRPVLPLQYGQATTPVPAPYSALRNGL
nr:hypothetical protein [uncultured bacterium]